MCVSLVAVAFVSQVGVADRFKPSSVRGVDFGWWSVKQRMNGWRSFERGPLPGGKEREGRERESESEGRITWTNQDRVEVGWLG